MAPDYAFRPMTIADLPLIRRWLAEPHVAQWWGDPVEQYDLVSGDLNLGATGTVTGVAGRRPITEVESVAELAVSTRAIP